MSGIYGVILLAVSGGVLGAGGVAGLGGRLPAGLGTEGTARPMDSVRCGIRRLVGRLRDGKPPPRPHCVGRRAGIGGAAGSRSQVWKKLSRSVWLTDPAVWMKSSVVAFP